MNFDAKKVKEDCVNWIRDWFEKNGPTCNAIVGISGGIDSAVVAALCCEAIGSNRVKGILLPNGKQADLKDAQDIVHHLKIGSFEVNIENIIYEEESLLRQVGVEESETSRINLPARIRMATLYMFSQSMNGRVVNTCNLSETWVGYDTRWGDSAGDFAPIKYFTKTEIRELAKELNLPTFIWEKKPQDGLCGKTDEERFGFTYEELDHEIRNEIYKGDKLNSRIREMHNRSVFKSKDIPYFPYKEELTILLKSEY